MKDDAERRAIAAERVESVPEQDKVLGDNRAFATARNAVVSGRNIADRTTEPLPVDDVDAYALDGLAHHVFNTLRGTGDVTPEGLTFDDVRAALAARRR